VHAAQLSPDALRQPADDCARIGNGHMPPLREALGAPVACLSE
jgi:hypothetical protein